MAQQRTHYEVLGVSRTADARMIKAAFRKAARSTHPDHGGDPAEFRLVTLAFETLSDPAARAAYDRSYGRASAYRRPASDDAAAARREDLTPAPRQRGLTDAPAVFWDVHQDAPARGPGPGRTNRPHGTVVAWLAAVRRGRPGLSSPAGAYVCASLKEEFGVALVEALATGLPVVAPDAGGPATFVADGVTGVLVDTGDPAALARAVDLALDLAARPDAERTADAARAMVRDRFSIEGMATALTSVYDDAVAHTADRSPTP